MKKFTLFIGLLLFTLNSEAVMQVYTLETTESQEISVLENKKSKKEIRQTFRKERRKMRKASRVDGSRPLTLARVGLGFSIGSIVCALSILVLVSGSFLNLGVVVVLLVLILIGVLSALLGVVFAGISFSQIKEGKLERKHIWIPILTMILGLGISLFWLLVFGPGLL